MSFIHKIKQLKPKNLINHYKRYYFHLTTPPFTNQISSNHNSLSNFPKFQSISQCPDDFLRFNVRFFAAPVKAKKKEEVNKPIRPRINEEIKAQYLRLVTDEGHSIIPLKEALSQAKSLGLDLVEVDREAKPPVCKIFDFHREVYKKQVRKKERAKLKAAGSLRKGTCKLVRISAKTETKDLQLKADTIKRLMERGYRVKCTVAGTEDQDLTGLVSQLCDLIEDIAFVEFGPKFELTQAHLVVRHIKFSSGKKAGKKASKINTSTTPEIHSVTSTDLLEDSDEESDSEYEDEDEDEDEVEDQDSSPRGPGFTDPNLRQETENRYARNAGVVTSGGRNSMRYPDNGNRGGDFDRHRDLGPEPGFTENRTARSAGMVTSGARNPMRYPDNGSLPQPPPNIGGGRGRDRDLGPGAGPTDPNVRQETENRYARSAGMVTSGARNPIRYPDNGSHPQPPPNSGGDRDRGPGPGFTDLNVRQEIGNRYARSAEMVTSGARNPMSYPDNEGLPQPPPNSGGDRDLRSKSANFGVFSNPNRGRPSDGTRIPNPGPVPGDLNPVLPKPDDHQKPESGDKKFGIFSK